LSSSLQRDPSGTAYYESGAGAAIVLLHGVGLRGDMWRPVADRLAAHYRVIVPDLLGHGESPVPPAEVSLADYASQVAALLRHLGVERAGIVGFSMGAMVAQRFAIDHPGLAAGVALVCAVHDRSMGEKLAVRTRALATAIHGLAPSVPAALERWFTPSFAARRPDVVESVKATMIANDPVGYLRSYALFAQADEALAKEAGRIRAPVLIVAAADDVGSTPQMAAALHRVIAGSQLSIVPGIRHMLPVEDPERLVVLLESFFRSNAR
jgi:pimeloyl-ACP methyl ester carboxylesterase